MRWIALVILFFMFAGCQCSESVKRVCREYNPPITNVTIGE